ncbi:unnamed protein product [Prorocentrum cordatum]|uniref:diacylglycerol O-acyltransferase n=1 Tax=Prorocentrum cordatum TaxID=2364126 RepID=A0ABN9Y952_9DINO|nr:unnamed protein product [Polarella glacialis]
MKLTREEELDPEKNYVFGYHPHGIISLGALCNFGTEATGFAQLFPGIDLRLLTLTMNFRIPFFREYLLGMGINDVSRESCERNLSRGPGSSIMIVVGGARESIETAQGGRDSLILSNRKGFVKLALRKGASLVPVYSFGENDVFGVFRSSWLTELQIRMQKKLGFAVPLFFGRALTAGLLHRLFGLNVGVLPLRVPIHSVVGKPIHLKKTPNPSQEEVDEAHARYMEELKRIHSEWKDKFEKEREDVLKQCDAERAKIYRSGRFRLDDHCELSFVE